MIELKKSPVLFLEDEHRYFLGDKELRGVTSSLIHRAFPDLYKDVDPEVLAKAAAKGKELHALIEYHDNFGTADTEHADPRVTSYEQIKRQFGLRTIANEYLVSDEQNYASSIDIVMLNADDEICLVDTKTTYNLNLQTVSLQLSIYKRFFEQQNPDLKVSHIYVLWLPNKDHSIAQFHELSLVSDDVISALIKADLADEAFDVNKLYGTLPVMLQNVEDEIVHIELLAKMYKARYDELKKGLYEVMEQNDIKSFAGSKIKLSRVLPTTTKSFDSARFKAEHPDLYEQYCKDSVRSGSLKITVQDGSAALTNQ